MKKNIGKIDRIIRIIVGIALLAVGSYYLDYALGLVFIALGIISLGTSLVGWCGLYRVLGINTCKECSINNDAQTNPKFPQS